MSYPQIREQTRKTLHPRVPISRRNLLLLGAAVLTVAAGYGVLETGSAAAAAVLLVFGYCVLFPLGIAL
ncbi:MAG TPA: hypothetical protein VFW66_15440 [Gemmatimonadales bacterium]|nr:hypothetical protein [Gemmatimonadales bacterium]